MAKARPVKTPAIREMERVGLSFELMPYAYEDHGGTAVAARELGVDEHAVIKTLVLEDQSGAPLIMLMHGDREVSLKNLARALGAKTIAPCDPAVVTRHTGFQVGGCSPFGTRKRLPVYVEASILDLGEIFLNAGKRGLLARLAPADLEHLNPTTVHAAQ